MSEDVIMNSIGHELKAINHVMQRRLLNSVTSEGIDKTTVMHGWIIGYLKKNRDRDVYQKDIEFEFSISRSAVTNIVKCMEKNGYINRTSVNSDARLKKLILTEKGERVGEIIRKKIIENEQHFDSVLSKSERETFIRLVRKLRHGIETNSSEGETIC